MKSVIHSNFGATVGLAVAVFVMLSGCQKNDSGSSTSVAQARANSAAGAAGANAGVSINGQIGTESQYQSDFEQAVQDFMAARIAPNDIGYVDATGTQGSGVFFGGAVTLASGTLRTASGQVAVSSASRLFVQINDVFKDGTNAGPLPQIYMTGATGYVQGNYADITFNEYTPDGSPSRRSLRLVGLFTQSTFTGDAWYDVSQTVDGSPTHAGKMGQFSVPTCSFFNCN